MLLDACVLVPIRLTTTLLWLAEAGLFRPLWSEAILTEVQRALPKVGIDEGSAARRVTLMREAFGAAALVEDFGDAIDSMLCDSKDRHVLAAAVAGRADILVTFNLRDFPSHSVAGHELSVAHPDRVLLRLLTARRDDVLAALETGVAALRKPAMTVPQFLATLEATVPRFAREAGALSQP